MPIPWKTSTEGLDGSKRPYFNLRWDVSPPRRVPPPTKERRGSRQNTVGTHERHIRAETLYAGCAIGRIFRRGSRAEQLAAQRGGDALPVDQIARVPDEQALRVIEAGVRQVDVFAHADGASVGMIAAQDRI